MKSLAVLLALALAFDAAAAPAAVLPSTAAARGSPDEVILGISTITVTAPREGSAEVRALKAARTGGAAAGVAGLGWMGYLIAAGVTGPFGWAAAAVFLGGMTAYLAERRLEGEDDFPAGTGKPETGPPPAAARR
jgi:hypothetical protein